MNNVKLVGVTKPLIEGVETAEQLVAYAARVSNMMNQLNMDTATKLLNYLVRQEHWSPLEMVHIVMEINTTRDIGRQILRHRSFSFQEFSARYSKPTDLGFVVREARLQDTKNRQNSIATGDNVLAEHWKQKQLDVQTLAYEVYNWALENGIAKEQARAVLPEGMMMSRMYMAGSLRSWVHYCMLRMGHGTQKEHMDIARTCFELLQKEFPSITEIARDKLEKSH